MLGIRIAAVALLTVVAACGNEFFEKRIRPILVNNCIGCHNATNASGELRLDSRAALLKGGKSGTAVVVGQPDASLIIRAVRHEGRKMPLGGKLKDEEIGRAHV